MGSMFSSRKQALLPSSAAKRHKLILGTVSPCGEEKGWKEKRKKEYWPTFAARKPIVALRCRLHLVG